MAITTNGFQINPALIPQYQAVDPTLQGFQPQNITQGIDQSIKIASSLDQLKQFREHEAEWAKLADVRNQRARAEANLISIQLEHAQALKDAQISSEKARLQSLTDLFPLRGKAETGALNTQIELQPGAQRIGLLAQAGQEAVLTFANLAGLENAKTAASLAPGAGVLALNAQQGVLNRQPDELAAADLNATAALERAQFEQTIRPDQFTKINQDLQNDLKFSTTEREQKIAADKAHTALFLAQADNYTAQSEGAGRYEKDSFVKYQKMEAIDTQLQAKEASLWNNRKVTMPNGQTGTLAEYWSATRTPSGDAKGEHKIGNFFLKSDVPKNPEAESLIAQLVEIKKRRAALVGQMSQVDLMGQEAPPASTQSNVVGATQNVIQNGVQYTVRWNGKGWEQVK